MAHNLSDRLIESSNDIFQKILETEFVQKFLMTGQLNDQNRVVAHRLYKNLSDMELFTQNCFKIVLKMDGLTPEEKAFYVKMDEENNKIYGKYLDDIKQAVGPIPEDFMSAPVSKEVEENQKLFTDLLAKNSVIHVLSSALPFYGIPCAVYQYLVNNPSYKENELAKLFTYQTLGVDTALMVFKSFVDNRANEVTPEVESELINIYRTIAEFNLKFANELING